MINLLQAGGGWGEGGNNARHGTDLLAQAQRPPVPVRRAPLALTLGEAAIEVALNFLNPFSGSAAPTGAARAQFPQAPGSAEGCSPRNLAAPRVRAPGTQPAPGSGSEGGSINVSVPDTQGEELAQINGRVLALFLALL